jgi:hypothetical protein
MPSKHEIIDWKALGETGNYGALHEACDALIDGDMLTFGAYLEKASDDMLRISYTVVASSIKRIPTSSPRIAAYMSAGVAMTYAELTKREIMIDLAR